MRLILASGNRHKAAEMNDVFRDHSVLLPESLHVEYDHQEVASSFRENALGKARSLYAAVTETLGPETARDYAFLADDSGLCVHALDGRPGIHSARYGETPDRGRLSDAERNRLLLSELTGVQERSAYFVCAMVLLFTPERFSVVQEAWHGEITAEPSNGTGGFGYDPVFYVREHGCTAAELSSAEKNRSSHRGRAASLIRGLLPAADALPSREA